MQLYADERLSTNEKRVAAQEWMLPPIRDAVAKIDSADLQQTLERAGVPYAPLRRPDQLLDDPHLIASGQLLPVPMEGGKIGNLPKLPFASSAYDFAVRLPPPRLGEHTREVLAETGLGEREIDALITAKVALQGERR